jgi:hypothetical protein
MVDLEHELRTVLRERADTVRVSPDLKGRIEHRVRRSRRTPRLLAAAIAIAAALGGLVGAVATISDRGHPAIRVGPQPTSPATTGRRPGAPILVPSHRWAVIAEPPTTNAFASVWTGNQLVVAFRESPMRFASYEPRFNAWVSIPAPPVAVEAPFTDSSTFVWTGRTVLVWGYENTGPDTFSGQLHLLAYQPTSNTWRRLADPPITQLIQAHPIWTGHELIVWGGNFNGANAPAQGAAYNPTTNHWRRIATAPLSTRENPMIVWTGHEMIAWGGYTANAEAAKPLTTADRLEGAAYDPTTDTWRPLPPSGLPTLSLVPAVWTGHEMIIFSPPTNGAAYDPTTNQWRRIATSPLASREQSAWSWTGRELLVWGGIQYTQGRQTLADGAAYDPSTNRWRLLPKAPIGSRYMTTMAWTGTLAIIVGGDGPSSPHAASEPPALHAAAYRP